MEKHWYKDEHLTDWLKVHVIVVVKTLFLRSAKTKECISEEHTATDTEVNTSTTKEKKFPSLLHPTDLL